MPASPNALNYFIGKGTLSWTPDGGAARDLGNVPEFEVTPEIETLDHFSSRSGIRSKDRSVVIQTGGTARIVLDEITPENLVMLLMGDTPAAPTTGGNLEFDILAVSEFRGALAFTGTNDIGNRFSVNLPLVSFKPSGGFNFISEDDWASIELTGEILRHATLGFGTVVQTGVAA